MKHLTVEQRYTIFALKKQGISQVTIAKTIDKHKSVVSREVKRNSDGRSGEYRYDLAQRKYEHRMHNAPKHKRFTEDVVAYVEEKLNDDLSPEQVVGLAALEKEKCVSHECIYQHIWSDKKQGGTLYKHLRTRGKRYRKRGASKDKRGIIRGRIDIDQRPAIVAEKSRFGDMEIDTVIGKNHQGALVTINDRKTSLVKIKKVPTKEALVVQQATTEALLPLKELLHTITADNGKEFAEHETISKNLEISFYFAKPYHSWERGANENTNGLIRQYFPKKTDFSTITDEQVKWVEDKLNNRPRKRLGFLTPNQFFEQTVNELSKVAFVT